MKIFKALAAIVIGVMVGALLLPTSPNYSAMEHASLFIENNDVGLVATGTYVGNDFILTARHVVADPTNDWQDREGNFTAKTINGTVYPVKVVWESSSQDLALLHVVGHPVTDAPVASLSCFVPKLGEPLEYVGNPHGEHFSLGELRVASDHPWSFDAKQFLEVTGSMMVGGVSGSGVYYHNQLIGVFSIGEQGALGGVTTFGKDCQDVQSFIHAQ